MAGLSLTMHREQMALITREMTDLRRLAEEIQALQGELHAQVAKPRLTGPAAPAPNGVGASAQPTQPVEPEAAGPSDMPPDKKETVPARSTSGEPVEDIHAWLNQRIASLTTEHQSRWQKLLGMIMGK